VAKEHGVPPYVVFHDATLHAIAAARPGSLETLGRISGVGVRKLENYGSALLRIVAGGD
jgi:ATP-dependent DNA helicase RecQ